MAAGEITVVPFARTGVDLATSGAAASADGDFFANTGKEVLAVTNASADPVDVTVESTAEVDGQAVADLVITVAAGATKFIGPFPKGIYNDDDDNVNVSYSLETDLTVAAFSLTAGV